MEKFDVIEVDPKWMNSIEQYNKLKISCYFYKLFKNYKFLLTYELDAFVFKDELQFWQKKKFDFIGAAWFRGHNIPEDPPELIGVGNSGFSLRNTKACLRILNRIDFLKRLKKFWFWSRLQSIISYEKLILHFSDLFKIKSYEILKEIFFETYLYEDRYWCDFIPFLFCDFSVAPVAEAIKFSFEVNPSLLYELNNHLLPFGCHAWEKYEPEFWHHFIDNSNSVLNNYA